MHKVLTKTLVHPFYRQNALMFATILLIAGGFMNNDDHLALARDTIRSSLLLSIYVGIWVVYGLFATRFAVQQVRRYDVLLHLRLMPAPRRWWGLWRMQLYLLLPALVYGWFVGRVAWQEQQTGVAVVIGAVLLVLSLGTLAAYEHALRHPNPVSRWAGWLGSVHQRVQTPYLLFGIRHLLVNMATVFWRTKATTALLWLGILKLYATDHYRINLFRTPDYDLRLIGLGALIISLSHATLVFDLYRFEHVYLPLYRNMPVANWQRWIRYVLQLALLLIPETVLFFTNLPVDQPLWLSIGALAFAVSLLALLYGLFLRVPRQFERNLPHLYILMIAYFLLIMFRLPLWVLAGVTFAAAGWLFCRHYWQSVWLD